jgi:hypothetical protein
MTKISTLFISLLILCSISGRTQTRVEKLAMHVIDTNDSQTRQASEIYSWITANIMYDVKAFEKYHTNPKSTDQILSTRKGVCADYSYLFSEMCRAVGIEAYTIYGYCKSPYYYKGKPFLRSNHAWNVFYADSAWHTVDATWGSGFVDFKPDFLSKLMNVLFRKPYSNNKAYFILEQDFTYFDISPDTLGKTHYPLDPKWFFKELAINYNYFENDSQPKVFSNPDYIRNIEDVRRHDKDVVYNFDSKKGHEINAHNYFDLANSYWEISKGFNLERDINESNLWQFEKYQGDYNIILQAISKHKAIADSAYRVRFKNLKLMFATQKRMTGKIKSKAKSAQKSFRGGKQQILGKNVSYRKKQEAFMINVGRTELKSIQKSESQDSITINMEECKLLQQEINSSKQQEGGLIRACDSLIESIDFHISDDKEYDDSIYAQNNKFNGNIVSLNDLILTGNETKIKAYVDSLTYVYSEIVNLLEEKKGTKSKLQETSKAYYSQSALYQKLLKEQITLLAKLYKSSNFNDTVYALHEQCVKKLIASYKQNIRFTQKVANHGLMQKDIRKENLNALKQQKENIVRENKYFLKWYSHVYEREFADYNNEKALVKLIKSDAQRNQKLVETKMKKATSH